MRSQLVRLVILVFLLGTAGAGPLAQTSSNTLPLTPVLVTITPDLHFGDVAVGSSDTLYAIIANSGDTALEGFVTVIGLNFTSFTLTDGNGGTIDPGDSAWITVAFNPQDPGPKLASLELTGNVEGGPFFIELKGYGVQQFPDLFGEAPVELDFSMVGGLSNPSDVDVDDREKILYIADTGNNRIVRWTDDEDVVVASVVDLGPIALNAPAASLQYPTGMCLSRIPGTIV